MAPTPKAATTVPPTPKRPKPTFDVAREPVAGPRSGWVYRSDAPAAPAPRPAARPEPPRFEPAVALPRSWMQSGLYLMAIPMAISLTLMITPVAWVMRSRSQK